MLNEICGRAIGFLMLYPRDFDQLQHFAHHRHTQNWARDGELARERYTLGSYLLWLLGVTYWYSRLRRLLRFAAGTVTEPYIRGPEKPRLIAEARWHLAGYAAIAVASLAAETWAEVVYWLAPLILTKGAHQLQNTIEHLGLTHAPDILENTRTVRCPALLRWLCWNMQYHTAHHAFPSVPFHALPELHREIVARSGREPHTMSYLAFQRQLLSRLARQGGEAVFKDDETWVAAPRGALGAAARRNCSGNSSADRHADTPIV